MEKLTSKLRKVTIILVTSLLPIFSLSALDENNGGTAKDLIAVKPQSIVPVKPGKVQLKVTAWVDRENLTYHIGETVQFYVKANKDCFITLLDIGTTGSVHIIFPNDYQTDNFVEAGQTIAIPPAINEFAFKVTGKKGKETIKVFATVDANNLIPYRYQTKAGPYKSIKTKDIAVVATGIDQYLNDSNEYREWDEYTKILTIK